MRLTESQKRRIKEIRHQKKAGNLSGVNKLLLALAGGVSGMAVNLGRTYGVTAQQRINELRRDEGWLIDDAWIVYENRHGRMTRSKVYFIRRSDVPQSLRTLADLV